MKVVINTAENGFVIEQIMPNRRGGNTHQYYIAQTLWELRNLVVELYERDEVNDENPN